MQARFVLLSAYLFATLAHAMHPDQMLSRPIDEIIVNEMVQPIQPSDLELLVVMQPGQCSAVSGEHAPTFQTEVRWTTCDSFLTAIKDAKATLPLHSYKLEVTQTSARAVLEAAKPVLGGRRYVAMIVWDTIYKGMSSPGCTDCSYPISAPMEMAVMDMQTGRKVWHSYHVSRVSYKGRVFESGRPRQLGLANMERLVNLLMSQRQIMAVENIGLRRTKGFLMTEAGTISPPVNPDARLIIVNDEQFSPANPVDVRYSVLLSALPPHPPVKVPYTIPLHGFVALNLPSGKYALQVGKDTTHEFEIGAAPVYLSLRKPQLLDVQHVRVIDEEKLRDLSADLVNALIPEMTPASWHVKTKHQFFLSQP